MSLENKTLEISEIRMAKPRIPVFKPVRRPVPLTPNPMIEPVVPQVPEVPVGPIKVKPEIVPVR